LALLFLDFLLLFLLTGTVFGLHFKLDEGMTMLTRGSEKLTDLVQSIHSAFLVLRSSVFNVLDPDLRRVDIESAARAVQALREASIESSLFQTDSGVFSAPATPSEALMPISYARLFTGVFSLVIQPFRLLANFLVGFVSFLQTGIFSSPERMLAAYLLVQNDYLESLPPYYSPYPGQGTPLATQGPRIVNTFLQALHLTEVASVMRSFSGVSVSADNDFGDVTDTERGLVYPYYYDWADDGRVFGPTAYSVDPNDFVNVFAESGQGSAEDFGLETRDNALPFLSASSCSITTPEGAVLYTTAGADYLALDTPRRKFLQGTCVLRRKRFVQQLVELQDLTSSLADGILSQLQSTFAPTTAPDSSCLPRLFSMALSFPYGCLPRVSSFSLYIIFPLAALFLLSSVFYFTWFFHNAFMYPGIDLSTIKSKKVRTYLRAGYWVVIIMVALIFSIDLAYAVKLQKRYSTFEDVYTTALATVHFFSHHAKAYTGVLLATLGASDKLEQADVNTATLSLQVIYGPTQGPQFVRTYYNHNETMLKLERAEEAWDAYNARISRNETPETIAVNPHLSELALTQCFPSLSLHGLGRNGPAFIGRELNILENAQKNSPISTSLDSILASNSQFATLLQTFHKYGESLAKGAILLRSYTSRPTVATLKELRNSNLQRSAYFVDYYNSLQKYLVEYISKYNSQQTYHSYLTWYNAASVALYLTVAVVIILIPFSISYTASFRQFLWNAYNELKTIRASQSSALSSRTRGHNDSSSSFLTPRRKDGSMSRASIPHTGRPKESIDDHSLTYDSEFSVRDQVGRLYPEVSSLEYKKLLLDYGNAFLDRRDTLDALYRSGESSSLIGNSSTDNRGNSSAEKTKHEKSARPRATTVQKTESLDSRSGQEAESLQRFFRGFHDHLSPKVKRKLLSPNVQSSSHINRAIMASLFSSLPMVIIGLALYVGMQISGRVMLQSLDALDIANRLPLLAQGAEVVFDRLGSGPYSAAFPTILEDGWPSYDSTALGSPSEPLGPTPETALQKAYALESAAVDGRLWCLRYKELLYGIDMVSTSLLDGSSLLRLGGQNSFFFANKFLGANSQQDLFIGDHAMIRGSTPSLLQESHLSGIPRPPGFVLPQADTVFQTSPVSKISRDTCLGPAYPRLVSRFPDIPTKLQASLEVVVERTQYAAGLTGVTLDSIESGEECLPIRTFTSLVYQLIETSDEDLATNKEMLSRVNYLITFGCLLFQETLNNRVQNLIETMLVCSYTVLSVMFLILLLSYTLTRFRKPFYRLLSFVQNVFSFGEAQICQQLASE